MPRLVIDFFGSINVNVVLGFFKPHTYFPDTYPPQAF